MPAYNVIIIAMFESSNSTQINPRAYKTVNNKTCDPLFFVCAAANAPFQKTNARPTPPTSPCARVRYMEIALSCFTLWLYSVFVCNRILPPTLVAASWHIQNIYIYGIYKALVCVSNRKRKNAKTNS